MEQINNPAGRAVDMWKSPPDGARESTGKERRFVFLHECPDDLPRAALRPPKSGRWWVGAGRATLWPGTALLRLP